MSDVRRLLALYANQDRPFRNPDARVNVWIFWHGTRTKQLLWHDLRLSQVSQWIADTQPAIRGAIWIERADVPKRNIL